jgi:hypoxanthine phosphoribosyltransferase
MKDDKIHENWDDVYQKSLYLAGLINRDFGPADEYFDYMVVVPRGGYFPANIVARKFGFDVTRLVHACVGSYNEGQNQRKNELVLGEMPPQDKIKGKSLLVIDEVCDTGETLAYITSYLKKAGAKNVHSGVLHYKPTNSKTGYKPDWTVVTTNKWIIYPWEVNEYTSN